MDKLGDCMLAGFLSAWLKGYSNEKSLAHGLVRFDLFIDSL